jgi:membrane peptidoglycan carboxypeptidase
VTTARKHGRPHPGITLVKLLVATIACGVLVSAIVFPIVGGASLITTRSIDTFNSLDTVLSDNQKPAQRSVILASDGKTPIANLYLQNRQVVSYDQLPDVAREALISIEDERFYQHHGVDVKGTLRALITNGASGQISQGGSTLTQQYVKQVLLYNAKTKQEQEEATADTLARKLNEAHMALDLEKKLSKDEILTRYMNIVYLGDGAYGFETAAQSYFGIPAIQLDLPQAALLAGLAQSPNGYDPYQHPSKALARRHEVLVHMRDQGYITDAQLATADSTPLRLARDSSAPSNGCTEVITANTGFFCDYVRGYLSDVLHLTDSQLYNGGLTIITTLDPKLQEQAEDAVLANVPMGNQAAAVMDVVQPGTGAVLAMAVNRTFGNDDSDPAQTTINLAVKPVSQGGSTYKAFTIAAALEKHVPFDYPIDSPGEYESKMFGYTVHNDSNESCANCTMPRATAESLNTYFIKLLETTYFNGDLTLPVKIARDSGLAANTISDALAKQVISNKMGSFTLGFPATSPLDMATAYATFAAGGVTCPPNPIKSITNSDGQALTLPKEKCSRVMPADIANGVNNILAQDADPRVSYNTTKGLVTVGVDHAAAGKTGTNNNGSSLWYVGYTPQLSGSVAVFNPQASSKKLTTIPGLSGDMYGRFSAKIWEAALAPTIEAQPKSAWPAVTSTIKQGNSLIVQCVQGMSIADAAEALNKQGLQAPSPDHAWDAGVPAGTVISQNPGCGATVYPGQMIKLIVSDGASPKPPPPPPPSSSVPTTQPGNHPASSQPAANQNTGIVIGGNQPGGNQPGGNGRGQNGR